MLSPIISTFGRLALSGAGAFPQLRGCARGGSIRSMVASTFLFRVVCADGVARKR